MIKFNLYDVRCGALRAKVSYSLDNRTDGRACVTIYASSYINDLAKIFAGSTYRNDTDTMTDYFDKGKVVLFADHPLYAEARAAAMRASQHLAARNVARGLTRWVAAA